MWALRSSQVYNCGFSLFAGQHSPPCRTKGRGFAACPPLAQQKNALGTLGGHNTLRRGALPQISLRLKHFLEMDEAHCTPPAWRGAACGSARRGELVMVIGRRARCLPAIQCKIGLRCPCSKNSFAAAEIQAMRMMPRAPKAIRWSASDAALLSEC